MIRDSGLNNDCSNSGSLDLDKDTVIWDEAVYLFNKGDRAGALFLFKKLEKLGFTPAIAEIANIYELGGIGIDPNVDEAKKWYMRSVVEQNAPSAHLALGRIYAGNAESNDDYFSALYHFEIVIEYNNHFGALFGLGYLYELGLGVNRDLVKAKELYISAAKQGHIMALKGLARVIAHDSKIIGMILHMKASFKFFWAFLRDPDDPRLGIRWR